MSHHLDVGIIKTPVIKTDRYDDIIIPVTLYIHIIKYGDLINEIYTVQRCHVAHHH